MFRQPLVVDLMCDVDIADKNYSISSNAEDGVCAKRFIRKRSVQLPEMTARHHLKAARSIEPVGEGLRNMLHWVQKIVVKEKN